MGFSLPFASTRVSEYSPACIMRGAQIGTPLQAALLTALTGSHDQGVALAGVSLHAHLKPPGGVHLPVVDWLAIEGYPSYRCTFRERVPDGQLPTR